MLDEYERVSQRSERASKRAKYERQKSQEAREQVEEMKEQYIAKIDSFDNKMKSIREKEDERLMYRDLARKDVLKNAGQKDGYFVGAAKNKELQERAKTPIYKQELEEAQLELKEKQKG